MLTCSSWRARGALTALAIGAYALVGVFAPARATVARTALPASDHRPAAGSQDRASSVPGSGVISIRVVPNTDGLKPPPARLYGAVAGAAGNATITAIGGNGTVCGTAAAGAGARYSLDITSADAACTTPGAPVTLHIGSSSVPVAGKAAVPEVSSAVRADLTAP